MITPDAQKSRFTGTLIGCAVGDALGAPLEGKSREEISSIESITGEFQPFRRYPAGQYTDDTQQTLAIVKAILAANRVDGATIAQEFAQLWASGEIVGAGPVARRAVERFMAGIPWERAALPQDLPYNGAAMRVAPVGLWNWDRPQQIPADAEVTSIVTHRHPLAIAGAIAVATAVAFSIGAVTIDADEFLETVSRSIKHRQPDFAAQILNIRRLLPLKEEEALWEISTTAPQREHGFGISVYMVPTVLMALYAFLKTEI